jgi:hypothetical protein
MKQSTHISCLLFGCLLYTTSIFAQTSLSEDFELTQNPIVLPESLRADAGYPVWRLVTMKGEDAVPYAYCAWLQSNSPWTQSVFGTTSWQAQKNCADGITRVSRLNVDVRVPAVGNDAAFWRVRPVGYQYMVPDHTLTKDRFELLMPSTIGEGISFVSDPETLARFMADVQVRISALEQWQTNIESAGGPLTPERLESWLVNNDYLQGSDIPEGEANDIYQQKGQSTSVADAEEGQLTWFWLILILLALLIAIITLVLWWSLRRTVNDKETGLEKTNQMAAEAINRIDDVRSGLEAQIEWDAAGRLDAPGFTNEMLTQLGDKPFELKMPGTGAARKKIFVYNRRDHIELFGMAKGHDRVDKIDVVAVYRHLAKALRPENNWVTGVTARNSAKTKVVT